ncbi:hypothetical protein LTR53_004370 [Teratosphaeriaceae sp. CCFEE 6253]|nr:hypothetical protein LTR53_004370 [Teratosphaeriaceae sp. CCFEE 6253]
MSALFARCLRWIVMPLFLASMTVGAPLTAVALPWAMLPTIGLLYRRRTLPPDRQADLTTLTYIYFGSATLGLVAVLAAQTLLMKIVLKPLFGRQAKAYVAEFMRSSIKGLSAEQIAFRATLASSWQNWAFLLVFTFVGAGLCEELLKYAPIASLRHQNNSTAPREVLVQYAVAAALGFSTVENVAYSRMAVQAGERGWKLALTIAERVIAGGPGHCLTAALLAINVAKLGEYRTSPSSLWQILGGSVLYHGIFDFVLFAISALHGNVGFVHPENPWTLTLYAHVRRAWRSLGA